MHTYMAEDVNIHYNSNLSGKIKIVERTESAGRFNAVELDFDDLVCFMAFIVKKKKKQEIENVNDYDILGFPRP